MVNIRNPLLIAFERVVSLKTIHAASEDLGLTQAAVTKRIQALELELGVTLFLRSRRGMALTSEGEAVLQYCRAIHEAEGQLIGKIAGNERQETAMTIVGPTSAISTRVAENCTPIYRKFPFLRLHLKSEDHVNLVEMVKRGEADLAIVPPSSVPNEMTSKRLAPDRYYLVASSSWKGRELKEILESERIIDFYEADRTTLNYLAQFDLEKYVRQSRLYVNENEALIRYVKQGVGFGTLTESVSKPYLDAGELIRLNKGQTREDPLALVWYARSRQLTYFEEIVRSIR
jgi:LysR family transcriptional regulator (chromosome initiation inhibitor)